MSSVVKVQAVRHNADCSLPQCAGVKGMWYTTCTPAEAWRPLHCEVTCYSSGNYSSIPCMGNVTSVFTTTSTTSRTVLGLFSLPKLLLG